MVQVDSDLMVDRVRGEVKAQIPAVIERIFDKAYQYDDIMRLMHNRFGKHNLAVVQSRNYWTVLEAGLYVSTRCDSFTEAFSKALDRYLELELEKGINEHPS